jgi:hypothetical protein
MVYFGTKHERFLLEKVWITPMRNASARALALLALALLITGCGPDLRLLNSPDTLFINAIALTGADSGWAVGLLPGQNAPVMLRETGGVWQRDLDLPPLTQGETLLTVAVQGATLWVGGTRTDAAHGDATQDSGFVFRRDADGAWHAQNLATPVYAMTIVSPTEGWAVGGIGAIYHEVNDTWTQAPDSMQNDLYAIAARAPNDIWAVGQMGMFLHYDGKSWTDQAHFTHDDIFGMAISANDGWAVGTDGASYQLGSNNQWSEIASPMNVTGRAVAIVNTTVWITGDHGLVFEHTTDDNQWIHIPPPQDAQLSAIAVSPGGTVWVGGQMQNNVLYRFDPAKSALAAVMVPLTAPH